MRREMMTMRIDPAVKRAMEARAAEEGRTLSQVVERALAQAVGVPAPGARVAGERARGAA